MSGKISKNYKKRGDNSSKSKFKQSNLDVNLKGFLCYSNNRERESTQEALNILIKYADLLYGTPENINTESDAKIADDEDIGAALSSELSSLKESNTNAHFKVNGTGARNIVFIRTNYENPVEISKKIVEEIQQSKIQETRFLLRLLPIGNTCKAYTKDIVAAFEPLLEPQFTEKAQTFSVIFNHRNNHSLSRDEVIKAVAEKIGQMRTDHQVNLTNPELSAVIEVIGKYAFLSVVPNFTKFKKYNLLELSKTESDTCNNDSISTNKDDE